MSVVGISFVRDDRRRRVSRRPPAGAGTRKPRPQPAGPCCALGTRPAVKGMLTWTVSIDYSLSGSRAN